MNRELFNYLICPEDKEKLNFIEYHDDYFQGVLKCPRGHYYPIFNNVPVLIKNKELPEFFNDDERKKFLNALECLKINFIDCATKNHRLNLLKQTSYNWSRQWKCDKLENTIWEDKNTFLEHIPLDDTLLNKSKFILEIGCGNGRNIQHVKRKDSFIFAVDISDSAYYAKRRYGKDDNVFLIRCDANYLPFNNNFFDFVFSDHVLQHIDNLENCFKEIGRVSRENSVFIFNLYSRENNFVMTKIFEPSKTVLKRLPMRLVEFFSNIPAFFLWFIIKFIYLPTSKYAPRLYKFLPLSHHFTFWLSMNYKTLKTICFDLMHAPIANYYSKDDINKLSKNTSLKLFNKYLFRQTLWVCIGKFIK